VLPAFYNACSFRIEYARHSLEANTFKMSPESTAWLSTLSSVDLASIRGLSLSFQCQKTWEGYNKHVRLTCAMAFEENRWTLALHGLPKARDRPKIRRKITSDCEEQLRTISARQKQGGLMFLDLHAVREIVGQCTRKDCELW
jgi:hypothetical protein